MAQLNYTVAQINSILAKALAMTVPTLLSQLTNDEGFIKSADIPTKTSDLTNDSGFVTNAATQEILNEFVNYYTKTQTYSKTEVDALVNALKQFEVVVVSELPAASASTLKKMYLVPADDPKTSNVKDEYVTVQSGNNYSWEKIGSTAVSLEAYSTTAQTQEMINTAVATKVDKVTGKGLSTNDLTNDLLQKINSAVLKGTVIESNVTIAD